MAKKNPNTENNEATATETAATEKQPKVVKHIDAKIADAREDVAAAQRKLELLLTEKANRERTENIGVGEQVSFEFGRGAKRRILSGTITAVGNDEKLGKLLAVTVGEGLDASIQKIRAVDVLFESEIAERQAAIDASIAADAAADPTAD